MMNRCARKSVVYYEKCQFVYQHKFFNDQQELTPESFELLTDGPNNKCTLRWKVEYLLINQSLYHVKVTPLDELTGNSADVKITADDCSSLFKFDMNCSATQFKLMEPSVKIGVNSCMNIEIFISHESENFGQLLKNYNELLLNEQFNDVTFVIGREKFAAHRQILSTQSSVFKSMFEHDMLEKTSGVVKITDVESNTFKLLLRYIYYGKVNASDLEDWLKLLVAADKYDMTNLSSLCEDRVIKNLNVYNVSDALVTADRVNAEALKEKSVNFIVRNKRRVINTKGFKNLVKTRRADLLYELLHKV